MRIALGILAGLSFLAAVAIPVFSSKLETSLTHLWASLFGKKLPGREPSKQPCLIWIGFIVFICTGTISAGLVAALSIPSGLTPNTIPSAVVAMPTTGNVTLQPLGFPDICQGGKSQSSANKQDILFSAELVGKYQIYKISSDGSNRRQLTNSNETNIDPVCSPSGLMIAYDCETSGQHNICIMNADGSDSRKLISNATKPTWSPDEKHLAFESDDVIQMINLETSEITQLTNSSLTAREPAWSPDGNHIVFISPNLATEQGDVYLLDILSKESKRMLSLSSYITEDLEWSPNGRCLAYVTLPGATIVPQAQIFVPETGEIHALSDGVGVAWSPDGQSIAVSQFLNHTPNIALLNLTTGDKRWITQDSQLKEDISWCTY